MSLSIVKQIIKDTDVMFISVNVKYLQSYILWMVKEFVRYIIIIATVFDVHILKHCMI